MDTRNRPHRRRNKGNAISEFGPALFVLLIFIFFPVVDLLSIVVSYGACMVLNFNQVHEAALIPHTDAADAGGPIKKGIPDQWLNGMGRFVKMVGSPQTNITYRNGETAPDKNNSTDKLVMVETKVVCSPFLPIPLPVVNVPGLNGPFTFDLTSERPMENPDYAP